MRWAAGSVRPRFTPTHVGNTCFVFDAQSASSVHPHACGEHVGTQPAALDPQGSPPRMWGTRANLRDVKGGWRFTPTHVGNTTESVRMIADPNGSPPRMWGTRRADGLKTTKGRFTPTHVGNTDDSQAPAARPPVHPHACGEHYPTQPGPAAAPGSPPRMWGTLVPQARAKRSWRFTPTHVGNTAADKGPGFCISVHPHACGEHMSALPVARTNNGSPPRMWGTLDQLFTVHCVPRFTPTHVGNTGI